MSACVYSCFSVAVHDCRRVKIGQHIALKLLRAGATVIITTRFPVNALERLHSEPDWSTWADRVRIYGLDLRDLNRCVVD